MSAKNTIDTTNIPKTPLSFFIHISKPFVIWVFFSVLIVTIASVVGQSLPLLYKWIIEAVTAENFTLAFWLGMAYPLALFIESLLWRTSGLFGMKWTTHVRKYSNDLLVEQALQHGQTYFSNRFAGSLLNKVRNVIGGMETFVHDFLWTILGMIIGILVTIYYLFTVNHTVAYIFIGFIVFLLVLNRMLMPKKQELSRQQALLGSKVQGMVADMFSNASVIRQFTGLSSEVTQLKDVSTTWRQSHEKSWLFSEWTQFINGFVLFLFFGLMMYVLLNDWESGGVTTAEFIFVLALIAGLTGRLVFVGKVMTNLARTFGEVEEGLSEIFIPRDIIDQPNATTLTVPHGKIEWEKVNFVYGENKVFHDFTLTIPAGQRLGLVGQSGAGKSTFVSLLLRQHDLSGGKIEIDGQPIHEVTQDSLRANIAVVPQEPALFHRTIRENIAYGKPDATDEEIIEVAKKAYAHEFIDQLPQRYDTLVGERGVKLSGGQKQRIAIARAMLKDAPILILDEATSALDSESEMVIQKALHILMAGKTVIAIAHRLSTLREMDRIIVLDSGSIIEDGSHDSLLAYDGTYAKLWQHQAGGFVGE